MVVYIIYSICCIKTIKSDIKRLCVCLMNTVDGLFLAILREVNILRS